MNEYSYQLFAATSEQARWNVESDIDWAAINVEIARSQPEVLDQIRDSALIESYHPMSTLATIQLVRDDIDASSILQVEQFEGFRHFWVLRRYLDAVGYERAITDEELVRHRTNNVEKVAYKPEDKIQVLVNFTWSEHFAGYFFKRLAEQALEPVLKSLLHKISGDEFRHAHGGFIILKKWLTRDPQLKQAILRAANQFRHYGTDVVDVPISLKNDSEAIMKVIKKTQQVCGAKLSDFLTAACACG